MSVKSKPFYWLVCDDCGYKSTENSEAVAWSDVETARLDAEDDGAWFFDGSLDWCGECRDKHVCRECDKVTDDLTSLDGDGMWPVCPDCKGDNK